MRLARPLFALAFGLGAAVFACVSTLPSGAGGGVGGLPPAWSATGGSAPTGEACASCLDHECAAEKAACGADCYAIQACLDSVCFNLSAIASADEGLCQRYCQGLHSTGVPAHLAYVNCAYTQPQTVDGGTGDAGPIDGGTITCLPPCLGYPYDYDLCVAAESAGPCKPALEACDASSECKAYEACAGACTSLAVCQACAVAGGDAGEALYESYQLCLDRSCLAQGWLPHF
jgi:hypothetical protein